LTDSAHYGDFAEPNSSLVIARAESGEDRAACLRLRFEVFVEEQKVSPEEEIDGIDDRCLHYLASIYGRRVGTARVIPKGALAKIGRVAVVRTERGKGIGLSLMRAVLEDAAANGFIEAALDSQTYAIPFYEKLGFVAEGEEFLDAGIPHYRMRRAIQPPPAAPPSATGADTHRDGEIRLQSMRPDCELPATPPQPYAPDSGAGLPSASQGQDNAGVLAI